MREVLGSGLLVNVPFYISWKNQSLSPENLHKASKRSQARSQGVESVGILGVESHFHSLYLMA